MRTTARAMRGSPSTLTRALRRRASARAPPSPSRCASEVVASSGASLARTPGGSSLSVAAGKSSSAPPAASKVSTRSVISRGMPCPAAAASNCSRSRLPSSRAISGAAPAIPDKAIARRGSIPICSVSRSRQTGNKPDFRAGRIPLTLPPHSDNPGLPPLRPAAICGVLFPSQDAPDVDRAAAPGRARWTPPAAAPAPWLKDRGELPALFAGNSPPSSNSPSSSGSPWPGRPTAVGGAARGGGAGPAAVRRAVAGRRCGARWRGGPSGGAARGGGAGPAAGRRCGAVAGRAQRGGARGGSGPARTRPKG